MKFFIKNPNLTKEKNILAVGRGGGGARVSIVFSFFQKNQSQSVFFSF